MITKPAPRSAAARRTGYLIGAAVNAVLLLLINVWPGWTAVLFGDAPVDWALVARVVLVVGIAGTVVAMVVQLTRLAGGNT